MANYIDSVGSPTVSGADTNRYYAAIQIAKWKVTYDAIESDKKLDKGSYQVRDMDSKVKDLAQGIVDDYWTTVHATSSGQTALDNKRLRRVHRQSPERSRDAGPHQADMLYLPTRGVGTLATPEPSTFLSASSVFSPSHGTVVVARRCAELCPDLSPWRSSRRSIVEQPFRALGPGHPAAAEGCRAGAPLIERAPGQDALALVGCGPDACGCPRTPRVATGPHGHDRIRHVRGEIRRQPAKDLNDGPGHHDDIEER